MNRLKFILKFIVSKQNTGKFNWNLLFPFAGVIIGCFTVALTLAVMEGMEYAKFTKLENWCFNHFKLFGASLFEVFVRGVC